MQLRKPDPYLRHFKLMLMRMPFQAQSYKISLHCKSYTSLKKQHPIAFLNILLYGAYYQPSHDTRFEQRGVLHSYSKLDLATYPVSYAGYHTDFLCFFPPYLSFLSCPSCYFVMLFFLAILFI